MKNLTRLPIPLSRSFYLLPLIFLFLLTACEKEAVPVTEEPVADVHLKAKAEKVNSFFGPARSLGTGVARAVVNMTHDGKPESIGVKISEKALENLPEEMQIFTLQLPNKAEGLAFDHIDLDWNPHGHEPDFLYALPHFDVHFYMISEEEKAQLTDHDLGVILPEEQYWPETYFPTEELVPQMGMHWLSSLAPELHGEEFTHTFIYGSYDGEFIFYEPMITLDFLKATDSEEFPIFQPQAFAREGYYYPTTYSINHDAKKKEYIISLENMVLR